MKTSIALTVLILAIGGFLGWQDHQRLVVVRASHDQLTAAATAVGITVETSTSKEGVRITKRERENKDAIARQAAADFIAFAREIEAMEKNGGPPDAKMQQRILDFMDRMMAMDASQLKPLIAEFRSAPGLKDETRQGLIGFSIMTLANDHPQAALTLFTESSDLLDNNPMGKGVIISSLAKWAKDDPLAALEWARANGEKHPDLVTDDAKAGIIAGAAANDPKLAFSLIAELGLKDPSDSIGKIADAARTPAERTATFTALQDYLATITDPDARKNAERTGIDQLTHGAMKDGFEVCSKWIAETGLSQGQLAGLGSGSFTHLIKGEDSAQWIDWMGTHLPKNNADQGIQNVVSNWTSNDYQAAGTWLASAPAGPTKESSVHAYAITVAEYEPETAVQWALTLQPGKQREQTFESIYRKWPRNDAASKAAAEAFADEHAIKR